MLFGDILYSTQAPNSNWLQCNGAAYLQSSYPALYTALGLIADMGPQVLRTGISIVNYRAVIYADSLSPGDPGAISYTAARRRHLDARAPGTISI